MIFWYGFKFFKSSTHLSGKSERPQLRQGSGTFSLGTSTLVAFGLDFCFPRRWICPIEGSSFWVSCNVFFTRFFSCILKENIQNKTLETNNLSYFCMRFLTFKCLDNRLEITCWGFTWMCGKSSVRSEGRSSFVVLGLSPSFAYNWMIF